TPNQCYQPMPKAPVHAAAPAGAVAVRREIHDTILAAASAGIEFFHGYTYSAHPLATAAILATLGIYERDQLFNRAKGLSKAFEDAAHKLEDAPHVVDVRNLGLVAGIELKSRDGAVGARAAEAFGKCFDEGVMVRYTGDILAISPPLIIKEEEINHIFQTIRKVLDTVK